MDTFLRVVQILALCCLFIAGPWPLLRGRLPNCGWTGMFLWLLARLCSQMVLHAAATAH